jgi:hypothetical protein
MNLEIIPLQEKILKRLSTAATEGKIDEVTRLSAMATKTKELQTAAERIHAELILMQRAMADPVPAPQPTEQELTDQIIEGLTRGRTANSTIEVTIDWSKNGQPFGVETISENLGSATIAKVIERLTKVLGHRVLDVASNMRVKRGPMISRDPKRDFWNASGGKPYGHRPINGTGFSVLTGTDSDQKVSDLTALLRGLSLVPGSFVVNKVSR